jgi:carboxyl-terminal processing protease
VLPKVRSGVTVRGMKLRLLLAWLVALSSPAFAQEQKEDKDSAYEQVKALARAMEIIRRDYVDEKKISYDKLTRAALHGMLQSLDPHSQFMEPSNFEDMKEDTESRFGGLGVHVTERNGDLIVVSPMEDSPGFKAGMLPGDQIIKIDGQSAEKMDLNDATEKLRGAPGTKITLTILRPGTKEIKDFDLVRETIKVWSVKDAKLLPADIAGEMKVGYARITQFNAPTADELAKKLDELEKQGMQALVLDLRYNPGGLITSAVDVAGMFLPVGTVVCATEGRTASQSRKYTANPALHRKSNLPLAVLINYGSASGSELAAGALKDLNRAILVGETSFGKGSVQSILPMPDGSALRLTTAKYYTPSHQLIHEHGVTPTIRASMAPEQERLLMLTRREDLTDEQRKRDLGGFHDTQLERAVDALKGVLVYAQKTGKQ